MNRSPLLRGFFGAALLGLLSFATPNAQAQSLATQIVGKWQAQLDDEVITLVFGKDGSFTLIEDEGTPQKGTYELDEEHDPAWLDIAMGDDEAEFSIVAIDDDGNLHITEPRSKRPAAFNEDNELIFEPVAKAGKPKPAPADDSELEGIAAQIIGAWEGSEKPDSDIIRLTFGEDGSFSMSEGADDPVIGTYTINDTKDPVWLDVTLEGEKQFCIIKIDDEGRLVVTEPSNKRPKDFSKENDPLAFSRVADEDAEEIPEDSPETADLNAVLLGTWSATFKEEKVSLIFGENGSFVVKEGSRDQKEGTYTVDASKDPFVLKINIDDEAKSSLLKFDDEGRLVMTKPAEELPEDFNEENTSPLAFTKEDAGEEAPTDDEAMEAANAEVLEALVGKWGATLDDKELTFTFTEDQEFSLEMPGNAAKEGTFTFDISEEPWTMNLIPAQDKKDVGYTIFEFTEDGQLHIAQPKGDEEDRPTDFSGGKPLLLDPVEE